MDTEDRIAEIEKFLVDAENALIDDVISDLSELDIRRDGVESKYESLKQEAVERHEAEKKTRDGICSEAESLVDGIRRDVYAKQSAGAKPPEGLPEDLGALLEELKSAIAKFEETKLPRGVRGLIDRARVAVSPDYKRGEAQRIAGIYRAMIETRDRAESEDALDDELARFDLEKEQEMRSIERTMSSLVDDRVDAYLFDVNKKIFS